MDRDPMDVGQPIASDSISDASRHVLRELSRLLEGTPYRVGALVLGYTPPDGRGIRMANGSMLRDTELESVRQIPYLVRALRLLADRLEGVYLGKESLPTVEQVAELLRTQEPK